MLALPVALKDSTMLSVSYDETFTTLLENVRKIDPVSRVNLLYGTYELKRNFSVVQKNILSNKLT